MNLAIGHGWDVGTKRQNNEDSYLVWQFGSQGELNGSPFAAPDGLSLRAPPDLPFGLFLVADGVGGAAAGEVASRLAVETVARELLQVVRSDRSRPPTTLDWGGVLQAAVGRANQEIIRARQQAGNDMGTTLVGALVAGSTAFVVNVGDSRAYLIAHDHLQRITHDHSIVQSLLDSGQIGEQDVRNHPQRNIILRSLGNESKIKVDLFVVRLEPEQTLLLCSDGLWEMTQDQDLARIVGATHDLAEAAAALVARANENGGADNISAILIRMIA